MGCAVELLRQYLRSTSIREARKGVPVGCIYIKKCNAGSFRSRWHDLQLGQLSYKSFFEIPSTVEDYAVIHISNEAAAKLNSVFISESEIQKSVSLMLQELKAEYFPGIRVQDRFIMQCSNKVTDVYDLQFDQHLPHKHSKNFVGSFTFAEMFAGIGGFRLGLEAIGGSCVFASEIDERAKETYGLNFEKTLLFGDITNFYSLDMPKFDVLTAGFPCQSFSVRGRQMGLKDSRGELYKELVRVLQDVEPKAFIFENVANLVVIDGGKRGSRSSPPVPDLPGSTFEMMLNEFRNSGYSIDWKIINSRHWLPQNRERVYIVGFRHDLGVNPKSDFNWSLGRSHLGQRLTELGNQVLLPSPEKLMSTNQHSHESSRGFRSTVRDILEAADSPDIQHCVLGKSQFEFISSPEFRNKAFGPKWSKYPNRVEVGKENWIVLDAKAPTLISGYRNITNFSTKYIFEEANGDLREYPRFFTHKECLRLMGFPDTFCIPHTQPYGAFYRQIGNAVCPPVITAIGSELMRLIRNSESFSQNMD